MGLTGGPTAIFARRAFFTRTFCRHCVFLPENVVASSHGDWTAGVKEENCEIESLLN